MTHGSPFRPPWPGLVPRPPETRRPRPSSGTRARARRAPVCCARRGRRRARCARHRDRRTAPASGWRAGQAKEISVLRRAEDQIGLAVIDHDAGVLAGFDAADEALGVVHGGLEMCVTDNGDIPAVRADITRMNDRIAHELIRDQDQTVCDSMYAADCEDIFSLMTGAGLHDDRQRLIPHPQSPPTPPARRDARGGRGAVPARR